MNRGVIFKRLQGVKIRRLLTIFDDCDAKWVQDIYLGLLLTGMRIGELVNLE
jgi:integrase